MKKLIFVALISLVCGGLLATTVVSVRGFNAMKEFLVSYTENSSEQSLVSSIGRAAEKVVIIRAMREANLGKAYESLCYGLKLDLSYLETLDPEHAGVSSVKASAKENLAWLYEQNFCKENF